MGSVFGEGGIFYAHPSSQEKKMEISKDIMLGKNLQREGWAWEKDFWSQVNFHKLQANC